MSTKFDLHIVLVEPEIPQNTGNIVRTCAALGAELHLVEPLGFSLEDRYLKRAGLDYWNDVIVATHESFDEYHRLNANRDYVYTTKRGTRRFTAIEYRSPCSIVFGKETQGLSSEILAGNEDRTVRIPMRPGIRSLNLSNAVAIVAYESLRQIRYAGLV